MGRNAGELKKMLYDMAKTDQKRRFHSLYDKIWRMDILEEAWESVKSNHGAPGLDGVKIEDIDREIEEVLTQLQTELRTKTYEPAPLKRVYIPKPNGKKRGLAIPTVKDRIVQAAVKAIMEPLFEPQFEECSFGFRPGRSAHDAVDQIRKYLNFGCEHVIDADISACFDSIPKDSLMNRIALKISDGATLHLIRQILDTGIMEDSEIINAEKGTPQGSPLSPLLANIYLDQIDKRWKHSGLWKGEDAHLVRYADDLVIMVGGDPEFPMMKLRGIIHDIGLELNEEKTRLVEAKSGFDFLGFRFFRVYSRRKGKRVTVWFPSPRSEKSIRARIRSLTGRVKRSVMTPEEAKDLLIPMLRGWSSYFSHSLASRAFTDVWNYAQLRLMYMHCKQHNKPSSWRNRDILRLGLSLMEYMPKSYIGAMS